MHATCPPQYRLVNTSKSSQLLRFQCKIVSVEAVSMLMRCKSYRKQAEKLGGL
jgi:hypothetical protein